MKTNSETISISPSHLRFVYELGSSETERARNRNATCGLRQAPSLRNFFSLFFDIIASVVRVELECWELFLSSSGVWETFLNIEAAFGVGSLSLRAL